MSMAFDVSFAETVGEMASLPVLFVGSGSFFLAQKKKNGEEEASATASFLEEVVPDEEVDLYRDTALRYAGYANEVGEAFRPLVPAWVVPASYGVAITYVLADTVDKTLKAFGSSKFAKAASICAVIEGLDAFVWQITASVALPGYTIHQVVDICVMTLQNLDAEMNPQLISSLPTAIGLLTIPFIVKPLDELAEEIMDQTLRKLWTPYLESCTVDYKDD